MSTITREQLRERARQKVKSLELAVTQSAFADSRAELEEELELARIALASLEAEAVYFVEIEDGQDINAGRIEGGNRPDLSLLPDGINHLYAAPPASVENTELQRKAAIHDALCEKYNVESLADFVDWQRNHIAELEAAPPAPVGEGETAVMPDYPGYVMTQRECYQAGAKRAVPEGWVAVPVELTGAMTNAMSDAILDDLHNVDVWRSVLAAAPQQEGKP